MSGQAPEMFTERVSQALDRSTGLQAGRRAGGRIGENSLVRIWNSEAMKGLREKHLTGRAGRDPDVRQVLQHDTASRAGCRSVVLHGRTVRKLMPVVERLVRLFKLPRQWLLASIMIRDY